MNPEEVLRQATSRGDAQDAVGWIADGHPLVAGHAPQEVLRALLSLDPPPPRCDNAIARLAREVATSSLDTAQILFGLDQLPSPSSWRATLDVLARKAPGGNLGNLEPNSVLAAQREAPMTIEVLCAIAGLSWRDLKDRLGKDIPAKPSSRWTLAQISLAWEVINTIIRGQEQTDIPGAGPARPIELLDEPGWERVEKLRREGVPYELLLLQRQVGSAWLVHRNATSNLVLSSLAARICSALKACGLEYRLSTRLGGDIRPIEVKRLAGGAGEIGLVVLDGQKQPRYAIAVSVARDGGTARKNIGRLRRAPTQTQLPCAILVAGPGWKDRNETTELIQAFQGRLYNDSSITALVDDIQATLGGKAP
ncbi:MAG: hypothetical protein ACJ8AT_38440 [Hyalangium sp.]|uniref:hypothetical protein n=1 Tax=Hyalangium sp. TaxID=2028555 RepID=UPI003899B236